MLCIKDTTWFFCEPHTCILCECIFSLQFKNYQSFDVIVSSSGLTYHLLKPIEKVNPIVKCECVCVCVCVYDLTVLVLFCICTFRLRDCLLWLKLIKYMQQIQLKLSSDQHYKWVLDYTHTHNLLFIICTHFHIHISTCMVE